MAAPAALNSWSGLFAQATEGAGLLVKPGFDGILSLISSEEEFQKITEAALQTAFAKGGWTVDSDFTRESFVELWNTLEFISKEGFDTPKEKDEPALHSDILDRWLSNKHFPVVRPENCLSARETEAGEDLLLLAVGIDKDEFHSYVDVQLTAGKEDAVFVDVATYLKSNYFLPCMQEFLLMKSYDSKKYLHAICNNRFVTSMTFENVAEEVDRIIGLADMGDLLFAYADADVLEKVNTAIEAELAELRPMLVFVKTSEKDVYQSLLKAKYWPLMQLELRVREQEEFL
jgi:hypothetical protein